MYGSVATCWPDAGADVLFGVGGTPEGVISAAAIILSADGFGVDTVWCEDFGEILGVNDQVQLAAARRVMNDRLLGSWMGSGVTIIDPASTWVDVGVQLEPGAQIGPSTQLEGDTKVGAGARIGPGCLVRDSVIAAEAP